jgi:hypothetical protein
MFYKNNQLRLTKHFRVQIYYLLSINTSLYDLFKVQNIVNQSK